MQVPHTTVSHEMVTVPGHSFEPLPAGSRGSNSHSTVLSKSPGGPESPAANEEVSVLISGTPIKYTAVQPSHRGIIVEEPKTPPKNGNGSGNSNNNGNNNNDCFDAPASPEQSIQLV